MEVAKTPTHHVKQTLPPSLSGPPGEAEIRYYVKVTVNRPQFFKENPRAVGDLMSYFQQDNHSNICALVGEFYFLTN